MACLDFTVSVIKLKKILDFLFKVIVVKFKMDQISITDSKRSWLAPGKGGMRGVIKNKIITAWLNDVLLRSRQSNNIQVVQARLNFSLVHMILGTKKIGVY